MFWCYYEPLFLVQSWCFGCRKTKNRFETRLWLRTSTGTTMVEKGYERNELLKLTTWFFRFFIFLWLYSFLDGYQGFLGRVESAITDPCKYTVFFTNWQPEVWKYPCLNLQWAELQQNKNRHSDAEHTFQNQITVCSIVFCWKQYVNFALFLNICKHIMVSYANRVK